VQDAFGLGGSIGGIKNKPISCCEFRYLSYLKCKVDFVFFLRERSMSTGSSEQETDYDVVVNQEGQYSIWPINKIVPNGWLKAGRQGSKACCLAFVDEAWIDMRPRSLQARTHSG
jgi:MbtH protein